VKDDKELRTKMKENDIERLLRIANRCCSDPLGDTEEIKYYDYKEVKKETEEETEKSS
tara:strand:+ start:81 stop:254 length:174 start_codon:yes stop_codon:yes gene_type:complete